MSDRTKTFDKQIGANRYEIYRIAFDGIRDAGGFNRRTRTERPQYKVSGKVVSRAVFFTLKKAELAGA